MLVSIIGRGRARATGLLAASLVVLASVSLAGCGRTDTTLDAPYEKPPNSVYAMAQSYTIDRIEVGDDEVCPLDGAGNLIVFSEVAKGDRAGTMLLVGDVAVSVGEEFSGYYSRAIEGGRDCGGKHYDSALHIVQAGIDKLATISE